MPVTLFDRARAAISSKNFTAAMAAVPLSLAAARSVQANPVAAFSFSGSSANGLTSQTDTGYSDQLTGTTLGNGAAHISGSVAVPFTFSGGASGDYFSGGSAYPGVSGGTDGSPTVFDLQLTGGVTPLTTSAINDVLATLIDFSASTANGANVSYLGATWGNDSGTSVSDTSKPPAFSGTNIVVSDILTDQASDFLTASQWTLDV